MFLKSPSANRKAMATVYVLDPGTVTFIYEEYVSYCLKKGITPLPK